MPNPVLRGARPRRAIVLMLAALVAVPAAVASTPRSAADVADTGPPGREVVLPRDPADADLGRASAVGDRGRQAEVKARHDHLVAIVEAPARAAAARKAKAEAAAKAKAAEAAARAKAEAEAAALRPGPIGPPAGTFPAVGCPGGGAITIDGSLAHNLNALIRTAWRDGVNLCGVGYRDPRQQIRLRAQNCGSSDYAVWHKPSGSCSPPTAVPGTSMHERGLAVDFRCAGQGMTSRSSPCFGWMAAHAGAFGLVNLPSEPWHWSTSGS